MAHEELDQAFHEELTIQGKAPAPAVPRIPASRSNAASGGPTRIKYLSDITKIPWWPMKPWKEFLDHRKACGLKNTVQAKIAVAREVLEIHDKGYDVVECLESAIAYGKGFHVARPTDTYPGEFSWSAY